MELWDHNGELFADIAKVNKVYPVELQSVAPGAGLAGWTTDSGEGKSTYPELMEHLGKVAMTATVRGGSGPKASLLTWHRRLGHLSFKTTARAMLHDISLPKKLWGWRHSAWLLICVIGRLRGL